MLINDFSHQHIFQVVEGEEDEDENIKSSTRYSGVMLK
jgi:hypothetical protein